MRLPDGFVLFTMMINIMSGDPQCGNSAKLIRNEVDKWNTRKYL